MLFPQLARSVAAIPVPGENPDHRLDADVVISSHDLSVGWGVGGIGATI